MTQAALPFDSTEFLNKITNSLLEAAIVVAPSTCHILSANKQAEELLLVQPGELLDNNILEWTQSPEDVFFWEQAVEGNVQEMHSETIVLTRAGKYLDVDRKISYIHTELFSFYLVVFYNRTIQKQVEYNLENVIAELRATFESIGDGVLVTDLKGCIRSYNQQFAKILNLPFDLISTRDDKELYDWMEKQIVNKDQYLATQAQIRKEPLYEGYEVLHLTNGRVLERTVIGQYARGHAIGRIYTFRNITEEHHAAARLRLSAKVFEAIVDPVLITDARFLIEAINPAAYEMFADDARLLIGLSGLDMFVQNGKVFSHQLLTEYLRQQGRWIGEVTYHHNTREALGQLTISTVCDEHNNVVQYVIVFRDISEKIQAKQRIEELAYTDMLTGLPNRLRLMERLEYMLPLAKRRHESFAVVFLDLDRFKNINDSLGHHVGDDILIEVSARLKSCVREVDMVARLGGDEFVLLLDKMDKDGVEIVLNRVMLELKQPMERQDFLFSLSCSMGVAVYPSDGTTADELIKNADTAMYRVKDLGREGYRFYQPEMNVEILARMRMDQAMRQGLTNGEFYLHYQPQIDLQSGMRRGVEALLRWKHPTQGMVSPAVFIAIAEETGFIVALGQWVLEEGLRQSAAWNAAGMPTKIAVNVSAIQFQQANFVETVAQGLARHGLPAQLLELELTESILVQDMHEALDKLRAFNRLGVHLSIDDFGTGYSSLAYLKAFPIQTLKIDRSFVKDLISNNADRGIADAIITLGRSLGLNVVAEGVETIEQANILRAMGCHEGQGFLWSPAVAPDALEKQVYYLNDT